MTKISWRFLSWLTWVLVVCATASMFYTSSAAGQLPKLPKLKISDASEKLADEALTKYINANQPIDYNYGELFPQARLPGTAFAPSNQGQVAAESAQLAQSANGEINFAPGDYALPVRLYCTHIYTGTAPGLNYLLAQLNGKRAHVITMLTARVGNKGLPYQPVQVLSWAIQNGQKYGDLTPISRALVDVVIPDQRAALGNDLVEQIRAYWNDYARGHRGMPDFDAELHRLGPAGDQILKYEKAKNAMSQHPDDFDALRNEFILEGQAPAAQGSDPPWSQVRPGVLERLIPPEGRWIGGVGTLQIRVLPTSAPTVAVPVTDIIGYPPNSMQPVTFSIVDLPGNAPDKGSSAPMATGSPAPTATDSSAPTATGCGGRPFSGQLRLSVTGFDSNTGKVVINGVDVRRPGTPFTWNWGDGTSTQGWFPQSYTYAEPHGDYTIQVISHEDAGPSDCAQLIMKFPSVGNAAPPTTSTTASAPSITSASPIVPKATQDIVIRGSGFGSQTPYDGDSQFLMLENLSKNWRAGCKGRQECGPGDNRITLRVSLWTDAEIHIEGLGGRYGALPALRLDPADEVKLWVWNAQTGTGPATYNVTVGVGQGAAGATVPSQPSTARGVKSGGTSPSPSGATNRSIRSIDFQNFEYKTNCLSENDRPAVVRVANGQANNPDGQFFADKPAYGDFKGDGHELAAVALSCHPADESANVVFSEVLVFEMSESGPKVLAKLPPSFWKKARVTGLTVNNQQLAADFLEMGLGSNACPEWIVTLKLRWNGTSFVNAGEGRTKNSCAR